MKKALKELATIVVLVVAGSIICALLPEKKKEEQSENEEETDDTDYSGYNPYEEDEKEKGYGLTDNEDDVSNGEYTVTRDFMNQVIREDGITPDEDGTISMNEVEAAIRRRDSDEDDDDDY